MKAFADFLLTLLLGVLNFAIGMSAGMAFLAVYIGRYVGAFEGDIPARNMLPYIGIPLTALLGAMLFAIGRQFARIYLRNKGALWHCFVALLYYIPLGYACAAFTTCTCGVPFGLHHNGISEWLALALGVAAAPAVVLPISLPSIAGFLTGIYGKPKKEATPRKRKIFSKPLLASILPFPIAAAAMLCYFRMSDKTPSPETDAERLETAAMRGDEAAIRKMLENSTDVNTALSDKGTALYTYISRNGYDAKDVEFVKYLLDSGANVDAANYRGETPLMASAKSGKNADIAKLLLERGADISAAKSGGANALIYCVDQYANPNLEVMRALINGGIDVNSEDDGGNTALIIAAARSISPEAVELLLEHGADANHANRKGYTAAMLAKSVSILEALERRGADIDRISANGKNAVLNLAVSRDEGAASALKWLAERGARTDLKDGDGNNALHLSAMALDKDGKDAAITKINALLECGADLNAKNDMGETALDILEKRSNGHEEDTAEVIEYIKEIGAKRGEDIK